MRTLFIACLGILLFVLPPSAVDDEITGLPLEEIDRDTFGNGLVLLRFNKFVKLVRLFVAMRQTNHGYRIGNFAEPASGVGPLNNLFNCKEA